MEWGIDTVYLATKMIHRLNLLDFMFCARECGRLFLNEYGVAF